MAQSVAKKNWYTIVAPEIFDNEELTETPSDDADKVDGRTVKLSLKSLMPSTNKYYMDVFLKVNKVEGSKAQTQLIGHETSKEYISKMIRRRSDRIDHVFNVTTKDDKEVRVKLIGATLNNTTSSAQHGIRDVMEEMTQEIASKNNYSDFMTKIFKNKIQGDLKDKCNKIYPLKSLEFRKTELIQ